MAAKSKDVEVVEEKQAEVTIAEVAAMSRTARQDLVAEATSVTELREQLGAVVSWEEIEVSFPVVDKNEFVEKPMVIGAFNFNTSTKFLQKEINSLGETIYVPGEFVSCLVATYDPDSMDLTSNWCIINDGSVNAGLAAQLRKYVSKTTGDSRTAPAILCPLGLKKSEYPLTEEKHGTVGTGTTYFIG